MIIRAICAKKLIEACGFVFLRGIIAAFAPIIHFVCARSREIRLGIEIIWHNECASLPAFSIILIFEIGAKHHKNILVCY